MNVQEQIKEWCKDGRFLRYANERMRKEITEVPENHVVTPEYEALDEGFEYDDRYAAPLAAYLTYRLQMAKLQKKAKVRKRGIWWVFVQVMTLAITCMSFPMSSGLSLRNCRKQSCRCCTMNM